jgi:hypothetical protein
MLVVMASVPSPTRTPRRAISITSAIPTALLRFDWGLCTTAVPVSASRSISLRETWMQWAAIERLPRIPKRASRSITPRGCERSAALLVGPGLGGVDVEPDLQVMPECGRVTQGGVGKRERGVQPEERLQVGALLLLAAADEPDVLGHSLKGDPGAVAVGDLVAEAGAQPGFAHGAGDGVQRAGDRARAGMVVDSVVVPWRIESISAIRALW